MPAILFHEPVFSTDVEPGDKLFFYEVGTTTDLTVYTDFELTAAATQPVIADSSGRFIPLYIDSTGNDPKVVLTDASDVEIWTCDRYPIEDLASLSTTVATNTSDITALEGSMAIAEADIDDLETESADYESRIAALEGADTVSDIAPLLPVAMGYFAQSATPTFGQSYGVSTTIIRNSPGDYTISFSTARANTNYIIIPAAGPAPSSSPLEVLFTDRTITGFSIETYKITGGATSSKDDRSVGFVVYDLDQ